MLIEEDLNP